MVKVSILGSTGTIGKNVAFTLAKEETVDEIVMLSRPESFDKVKGETYDMYDALAARDIDCKLIPSYNFEDIKGSAVVLIAAGIHREPGMNRLDLAVPNAKIVSNYSKQIAKYAPDSIILVATNPVDVMTTIALEASGFSKKKVIGVGNHLDSLRLKNYFSRQININSAEVHTRVVGEHGNHMVPLLSSTTIGGIPLKYFVEYVDLNVIALIEQLKNAGNTIISKKAPEVIKGKGQSVNQGEKKELSFTSNASYDDFKYVKLDGNELDPKNYTVKEGSTIVTLNKDFVSTLKAGKHTIGIVSETGEASTEFTVNKKTSVIKPSSDKNTTNTGLISNIGLWISLMFTSLEAMGIGLICRKKYKK